MAKVLVSRHLSQPAIDALKACQDLDVSPISNYLFGLIASSKIVLWEHNRKADREWLLKNAQGVVGLVVTLTDKVLNQ